MLVDRQIRRTNGVRSNVSNIIFARILYNTPCSIVLLLLPSMSCTNSPGKGGCKRVFAVFVTLMVYLVKLLSVLWCCQPLNQLALYHSLGVVGPLTHLFPVNLLMSVRGRWVGGGDPEPRGRGHAEGIGRGRGLTLLCSIYKCKRSSTPYFNMMCVPWLYSRSTNCFLWAYPTELRVSIP